MGRYGAVLLTAVAMLALHLDPGSAKPRIGKDGKIYACYKVKGKPRGAMRIVKSRKARCRRGKRKVSWRVRPIVTPGGTIVVPPAPPPPSPPPPSTSGDQAAEIQALEERVTELEERTSGLETVVGELGGG